MAQTPEGVVKAAIKKLLLSYGIMPASKAGTNKEATGWYFLPVSSGFGVHGIPDFVGCYRGRFWAIEAKAPKKKPSALQNLQINAIKDSGAAVFVVDGDMDELVAWLEEVKG